MSLQLALSMDGKMVATASSRGTLLRVFDTDTGSLLHVSVWFCHDRFLRAGHVEAFEACGAGGCR